MKHYFVLTGCLALLVGLLLAPAGPAQAFCIYNHSDTDLYVNEIEGGSFLRHFQNVVEAGGKACCNWKNKDCNEKGKRDSVLKFSACASIDSCPCREVEVKAGGWMDINGSGNNITCTAHF